VYVFRTRCFCMSIVCRGMYFLICSTFRFYEMGPSQCYVHQDIALWAIRSLRHHWRYDDLCHSMIEQFQYLRSVAQTQIFIEPYERPKFALWETQVHLSTLLTVVFVFQMTYCWFDQCDFMRNLFVLWTFQGTKLLVMTLIELSMTIIRDFDSRWRLLNMIRILFTCCTTDRSPNGLRYANRARRSISTTLFYVYQKNYLPFYIVPDSYRINEKVPTN
jgi:hypothetical protein